jgi:hypothetical protein
MADNPADNDSDTPNTEQTPEVESGNTKEPAAPENVDTPSKEESTEGQDTAAESEGSTGTLLNALLDEAKKEVAEEREHLDRQRKEKEDEVRLSKQRMEGQRRDELQRELMEETRKRNRALTRQAAEEKYQSAGVSPGEPSAQDTDDENIVPAKEAEKPKRGLGMLLAAIVVVGAGVGAYVAMNQPKGELVLPDIRGKVGETVSKAAASWKVEQGKQAEIAADKAKEEARKAQEAERLLAEQKAKAEATAKAEAEAAKDSDAKDKKSAKSAKSSKKAKSTKKAGRKKSRKKKLKLKKGIF